MHQVVKILSIGFINVKKVCKYLTILKKFGKVERHKRASFQKKKNIRAAPVVVRLVYFTQVEQNFYSIAAVLKSIGGTQAVNKTN